MNPQDFRITIEYEYVCVCGGGAYIIHGIIL